jgi:uncharacterized OB-fold protein
MLPSEAAVDGHDAAQRHPAIPSITPENESYWIGGVVVELRIRRCQDCGYWVEGPSPLCPSCWGRNLVAEATTGRGVVHTYSITYNTNYEAFGIGGAFVALPFITGIVELRDQAGLRITTNLVDCEPDEVWVGMPVRVVFEHSGDLYIPLFAPEVKTG